MVYIFQKMEQVPMSSLIYWSFWCSIDLPFALDILKNTHYKSVIFHKAYAGDAVTYQGTEKNICCLIWPWRLVENVSIISLSQNTQHSTLAVFIHRQKWDFSLHCKDSWVRFGKWKIALDELQIPSPEWLLFPLRLFSCLHSVASTLLSSSIILCYFLMTSRISRLTCKYEKRKELMLYYKKCVWQMNSDSIWSLETFM